jgi:AcrR family transcriptional regulator
MPRAKEQFDEMRRLADGKIRAAGLELFALKGLAGTNINEISGKAGISIGLLYHYYKSKEELYLSLANEAMDMSLAILGALKKEKVSSTIKLTTFLDAFLTGASHYPDIYFFIIISQQFHTGTPEQDSSLNDRKMQSIRLLADIIRAGQNAGEITDGSPKELAAMLVAMTQGLAIFQVTFGKKFQMPAHDTLAGILIRK